MYIYGKNVAKEALEKNTKIKKAYIYNDFHDEFLLSALQKKNIKIEYKTKREIDALANGNHQGIILDVPSYQYATMDDVPLENGFVVILDHLEDPHNFGAIIRTAEAAGVDAILIPKDRSVEVNSTAMKVSAGALQNMKIIKVINIIQAMKELKEKGFWFVGTDMEGEPYETLDYKGNIGIVIGNEGKGMSSLVQRNCDFVASIPMRGSINSLNASVAAGIIIFEAVKQRR